jgi:hypothetical protein
VNGLHVYGFDAAQIITSLVCDLIDREEEEQLKLEEERKQEVEEGKKDADRKDAEDENEVNLTPLLQSKPSKPSSFHVYPSDVQTPHSCSRRVSLGSTQASLGANWKDLYFALLSFLGYDKELIEFVCIFDVFVVIIVYLNSYWNVL